MDDYTQLTLKIKREEAQEVEEISIIHNDSGLDVFHFLNYIVAPLMLATGYSQRNIDEALGRAENE